MTESLPTEQQYTIEGLVIKQQSGFFTVQTDLGPVENIKLRGILLKEQLTTDPVAIGDIVTVAFTQDGSAFIDSVKPRTRAFVRQKPPAERSNKAFDREQVIIANPDQVVFVFACADPVPKPRALDRFLVLAERAGVPAVICANKIDLVGIERAIEMFSPYEGIGYPVFYTSAKQGAGVGAMHELLIGKTSAFTGPSGVGKSSLMNAIQPGLGLAVKTVSEATTKGRHTTVSSQMFPLDGGGYIADTPGIRAIGLYNIEPSEVDGYFPEIAPLINDCRFSDCAHINEPGCAVRAAAETGAISSERYESYLLLREEVDEIYYRC